MKQLLLTAIICYLAIPVYGEGDPIPAYKLRGVVKGQLQYRAAGKSQWKNKKIPKCPTKGRHFEICPTCEGSGQLAYHIKGKYAGIYDCMKCGPGRRSNSHGS